MRRGRGKNPNENPGVLPVQRVELSEKHVALRLIAVALLLVIGLGLLGYTLVQMLSRKPGWTKIEPVSTIGESVAGELTLMYELGASGNSPTAEYRELSRQYTDLCAQAYRIFNAQYGYEDFKNPHYLNRHPGEAVAVDPGLYTALETIVNSGNRTLFAGCYYREYQNLFSDTEDASAAQLDPRKSEEIAAYFRELSVFASDPRHVDLELLGDNTVRLTVSQEYQDFAAQNGVENFMDFYWMRNAFAVDYVAQALIDGGYVYGTLSSYDGYVRNFDPRALEYSYHLYGMPEDTAYHAARLDCKGALSLVSLRNFGVSSQDDTYYRYKTGERRHPHVDVNQGLCKSTADAMMLYGKNATCGQVLLSLIPLYVADSWDVSQVPEGMGLICVEGSWIRYTDPDITLNQIHSAFTAEPIQ